LRWCRHPPCSAAASAYQQPRGFDPAHPGAFEILSGGRNSSRLDLPVIAPGAHGDRDKDGSVAVLDDRKLFVGGGDHWQQCAWLTATSATCAGGAARLLKTPGRLLSTGAVSFDGVAF
jgi:hypothetical protein